MPYRRLPNTDNARMKALKAALAKGAEVPPFKLAFAQSTLQKLRQFYPSFEQMMQQQRAAISAQSAKSKEMCAITRKAKLYISHFYQVLNFAVLRGELPAVARKFYGLRENDSRIPNLNTEKEIIYWGEKLIKGESERISSGGNPVTNPTSAVVRVRYEQFLEACRYQKVLQKSTAYATDKISAMRADADNIITMIWNEVEATFDLLPEEVKREKATSYGIAYVFRPYEREEEDESTCQLDNDELEINEYLSEDDIMESAEINIQRKLVMEESSVKRNEETVEKETKEELQYSLFFTNQ